MQKITTELVVSLPLMLFKKSATPLCVVLTFAPPTSASF